MKTIRRTVGARFRPTPLGSSGEVEMSSDGRDFHRLCARVLVDHRTTLTLVSAVGTILRADAELNVRASIYTPVYGVPRPPPSGVPQSLDVYLANIEVYERSYLAAEHALNSFLNGTMTWKDAALVLCDEAVVMDAWWP